MLLFVERFLTVFPLSVIEKTCLTRDCWNGRTEIDHLDLYSHKRYLSCKYFATSINDVANLACSQSEAESGESQNTNPSLNMISATSFRCLSFTKRLPA